MMKKKLLRGLFLFALAIGGSVVAITLNSPKAEACNSCNFSNTNRKCGECGSSKLFASHSYMGNNGKLHTIWSCQDCSHGCVTEYRSGREVLLTERELEDNDHQEKPKDKQQ